MSESYDYCDGASNACSYDSYQYFDLSGTYEFRAVASSSYGKAEGGSKTDTVW